MLAAGLPEGNYRELYPVEKVKVKIGLLETAVPPHGLRVFVKGRVKGRPWTLSGGPAKN